VEKFVELHKKRHTTPLKNACHTAPCPFTRLLAHLLAHPLAFRNAQLTVYLSACQIFSFEKSVSLNFFLN
jgi:hypothetical protein